MSNLSNSATKKRDELGVIDYNNNYNNKATAFERGCDAGYEVGREESQDYIEKHIGGECDKLIDSLNQQVQLLEDALIKVGAYFDCLSCESQHGYVCEHHLDERMQAAIKALESLSQLRGGGKNTVEGIIEKYKPIQEVLKELENED